MSAAIQAFPSFAGGSFLQLCSMAERVSAPRTTRALEWVVAAWNDIPRVPQLHLPYQNTQLREQPPAPMALDPIKSDELPAPTLSPGVLRPDEVERTAATPSAPIPSRKEKLRRILDADPSLTIQQALAACAVEKQACPRICSEDSVQRASLCLAQGQALRAYQEELILQIARQENINSSVLLSAGCGAGKTKASILSTLACYPEVSHNVIVVPTMTLVKQFVEEIVQSCANWRRRSPAQMPTIALFTLSRSDEESFRELVDCVWVKHWHQHPPQAEGMAMGRRYKRACREARLRARNVLVGASEAKEVLSDPRLLSYFVTCTNSILSFVKSHAILACEETPCCEAECSWKRDAFLAFLHSVEVDALFERNLTCHLHGVRRMLIVDECHNAGLGEGSQRSLSCILSLTKFIQDGDAGQRKLFMSATPRSGQLRGRLCNNVANSIAAHLQVSQASLLEAGHIVHVQHMPILHPVPNDPQAALACFLVSTVHALSITYQRKDERGARVFAHFTDVALPGNGLIVLGKCNTIEHAKRCAAFAKATLKDWEANPDAARDALRIAPPEVCLRLQKSRRRGVIRGQKNLKDALRQQHARMVAAAGIDGLPSIVELTKAHVYLHVGDVDPERCAKQGGLHLVFFAQQLIAGVDWANALVAAQFTERKSDSFQVVGQFSSRCCRLHSTETLGVKKQGWFVEQFKLSPESPGAKKTHASPMTEAKLEAPEVNELCGHAEADPLSLAAPKRSCLKLALQNASECGATAKKQRRSMGSLLPEVFSGMAQRVFNTAWLSMEPRPSDPMAALSTLASGPPASDEVSSGSSSASPVDALSPQKKRLPPKKQQADLFVGTRTDSVYMNRSAIYHGEDRYRSTLKDRIVSGATSHDVEDQIQQLVSRQTASVTARARAYNESKPTEHPTTLDEEEARHNGPRTLATDIWKNRSDIVKILKKESKGLGDVSEASVHKYLYAFDDMLEALPACVRHGAMSVNISALLRHGESLTLRSKDHMTVHHKLKGCV